MELVGLFAGIGGLELGLRANGHHSSLLCEIWNPARAVLSARFPESDLKADVAALRSLPGSTELLVAGFPCQDLSQAGMTAGINGGRSSLVGHVFRLLDRKKVPWVILENVSFMLHLEQGRALRTLVEAFEERGYRWAYRVVNSLAFLPQRRERVIFVATTSDVSPEDILFSDEVVVTTTQTSLSDVAHGFYWTEGVRGVGWAPDAVPTLKNGSTVGIPSPPAILLPTGHVVTPDIRDAERLQGFDVDWTEPATTVGRPSYRWSLIGNAVSVPVAKWLGRRLAEPGSHCRDRDVLLKRGTAWPRSARFDGHERWAVRINSFPCYLPRPPLTKFLQFQGKPLSARATRGFLERTKRSTLRFVPGFLEKLEAHLLHMEANEQVDSLKHRPAAVAAE
jgi:DNA (cytosine-5)-methyltransferase 1